MKNLKKIFAIFLVLMFAFSSFSQDNSGVPDDDRGLFSNDENTKEKTKEKKSFWDRWFEIGIVADVGLSNNYFNISDFFQEEIIINLDEINNSLGNNGLGFNTLLGADLFLNLNTSIFKLSFFADVESSINFNLEKGLFEFLANGNQLDQDIVFGAGVGVNVFEENSISLEIPINRLKIKAVPSYFIPVIYVPYTPATITTQTKSDGTIEAHAKVTAAAYSALPLNDLENFSANSITDILSTGGFDISVYGEYKLFSFLDVGAFLTHVPIVPSKLNCTNKYTATANFTMGGLLDSLTSEEESELVKYDYSLSENEATEDDGINLVRPFKIGFNANWRVFDNKLLIISPMIQFKFADFTLKNLMGFGFDYSVTAKSHLGPFIPSFTTSCIDSVFSQQLDIVLNLRLFEIDLMISSQSRNFLKSFAGSGLGVGVGVKVGI